MLPCFCDCIRTLLFVGELIWIWLLKSSVEDMTMLLWRLVYGVRYSYELRLFLKVETYCKFGICGFGRSFANTHLIGVISRKFSVMLNEAKISRPRPRPELWSQGRGRGQFLDVEAKAEAKDKIMNKKYQMIVDNIQANLYHYDQNDTVYFSFSLTQ